MIANRARFFARLLATFQPLARQMDESWPALHLLDYVREPQAAAAAFALEGVEVAQARVGTLAPGLIGPL